MTAPTPRDIAETLRGAAREIQRRGWCQNAITDTLGRLCAVGAIAHAAPNVETLAASLNAFRPITSDFLTIPPWNDAPGRTQPEVEKALLQAADRIEVGE